MKNITNLLVIALITIFAVACESHKDKQSPMGEGDKLSNVKVDNKLDPICEMETAKHLGDTLTYNGKLYGFCSNKCKKEFAKNPPKYSEQK